MANTETIQIRVDKKTKEAARKTIEGMGLDMSSAVKLFLVNVVNYQGIPFDIKTENGFTLAQEKTMMAETEVVKQKGRKYATVDALMNDLES